MGIQINGQTDIISAIDGGLSISGADIGNASASNLNISGIVTATSGLNVGAGGTVITTTAGGSVGINSTSPERRLDVVDSGASGSVIRSRVTTNNGGYLAYEALNSSGTSVFSVTHNGRINLSENLVFASGQGIDFSATSDGSGTTTSELLDDYEEGTWTPNFTNVTYTPTTQFGKYTKIGRYVYCTIAIRGSISIGSGNIGLEGLPFSSADASDTGQRSCWHPANGGHHVGLSINDARFRVSGSTMQGVKGATGSTTYMTGNQLTSGTFQFTGDFSYYTSS